jgi:hypothetical protein
MFDQEVQGKLVLYTVELTSWHEIAISLVENMEQLIYNCSEVSEAVRSMVMVMRIAWKEVLIC